MIDHLHDSILALGQSEIKFEHSNESKKREGQEECKEIMQLQIKSKHIFTHRSQIDIHL